MPHFWLAVLLLVAVRGWLLTWRVEARGTSAGGASTAEAVSVLCVWDCVLCSVHFYTVGS
jgi:hypothetical protein